jgi:hypothetical protein
LDDVAFSWATFHLSYTLFNRVFEKNTFKDKQDSRNEILLLVYFAKLDGIIEEHEKRLILSSGVKMTEFTKGEQDLIGELMKAKSLPPLNKKYCTFSSLEIEKEVVSKIQELLGEEIKDEPIGKYLSLIELKEK